MKVLLMPASQDAWAGQKKPSMGGSRNLRRKDMKFTIEEVRGLMCGLYNPADMADNETHAEYLTRKLSALQAKCDALAAENAAIKSKVAIHAAGFSECQVCGHEELSETDDIVWMVNETPTPATAAAAVHLATQLRAGKEGN